MTITVLQALAAILLIYAAIHDFAARTVPNWLPACLLALGVALRLVDHSLLAGMLACGATFLVLFAVWVLGGLGGGDVKLWSATVLLIPPAWQPELTFLVWVVLLGGALAILYLLLCMVIHRPRTAHGGGLLRRVLRAEAWRISRRGPLPYAFAIAGSAILTLLPLSLQR